MNILRIKLPLNLIQALKEIVVKDKNLAIKTKNELISAKYIIAAPGRAGAEWFSEQCKSIGINLLNNQVDVGVRVEVPAMVFEHITDEVYEAKLVYRTKQYGDLVRTFCMNSKGYVVNENAMALLRSMVIVIVMKHYKALILTLPYWSAINLRNRLRSHISTEKVLRLFLICWGAVC